MTPKNRHVLAPLLLVPRMDGRLIEYKRQDLVSDLHQNSYHVVPDKIIDVNEFMVADSEKAKPGTDKETSSDISFTTYDPTNSSQQTQNPAQIVFGTQLGYKLPPRFIPDPQTSGAMLYFVMSQYEPMAAVLSFRPIDTQRISIRKHFLARMRSSIINQWTMYVGARMLCTLRRDGKYGNIRRFIPWLDRLDRLCFTSENDVSLDDLAGRLSAALELIYLRCVTSGAMHGYALLRHIAPMFVQVAFANPILWPRDPSSNGISLAHALIAPQHDLGRFILVDTVLSLAFGTPPLLEYDTSHPMIQSSETHPMEWAHGCPSEFAFSIVRINQWRLRHPNSCPNEIISWKEIETSTWAWRSRCDYGPDSESGRLVMRFSVQEGWRHAVLIYLYMGMCGATSHDLRVQASVRQISLLHTNIWSQLNASVYFMMPLLLAGICTRSESDRVSFRAIVSVLGHSQMWLLQGADFAAVLDHLWHGVAANGGPVTWDDYVNSRRAVIDLGV